MKSLLIERPVLCEAKSELNEETKEKQYYLEGPYLKTTKNRNGRIYPRPMLESEVARYVNECVNTFTGYGELSHPENRSHVVEDQISHRITEMHWDGDFCYGKSIITPTPKGNIIKALVTTGGTIGMSSRGTGSVRHGGIVEGYNMSCVDAVLNPSVAEATMNLIYENDNLLIDANVSESKLDQLRRDINNNKISRSEFDKIIVERFADLFTKQIQTYSVSFEIGNSVVRTTVNETVVNDLRKVAKNLKVL